MSNNLRNWRFREVKSFLDRNGFVLHKTKGSHFHYKKTTKDNVFLVVVAFHANKDIPIGTMSSIVRQSGISREKWIKG